MCGPAQYCILNLSLVYNSQTFLRGYRSSELLEARFVKFFLKKLKLTKEIVTPNIYVLQSLLLLLPNACSYPPPCNSGFCNNKYYSSLQTLSSILLCFPDLTPTTILTLCSKTHHWTSECLFYSPVYIPAF